MKINASRILSVTALIISLYFLIRISFFTRWIVAYLEQNFSPDNQLSVFTRFVVVVGWGILFGLIIAYCILVLLNSRRQFFNFISDVISRLFKPFINLQQIKEFFISDAFPSLAKMNYWIVMISLIVGFVLVFGFLYFGYPEYEGFIENVCAAMVFCAIIFILIAIFRASSIKLNKKETQEIRITLIVISILLFLYLGEELSWGQHIFNWQAKGVFLQYNYQSETNLHNFLNPVIPLFYLFFGVISFTVLFLIWFFPGGGLSIVRKILIPSPAFFILLFIMTGLSLQGQSELYEALLSLFVFLYGVRMLCITKTLKLLTIKQ